LDELIESALQTLPATRRSIEPEIAKLGDELFGAAECARDAVARYAELAGDDGVISAGSHQRGLKLFTLKGDRGTVVTHVP
jgi:hypothetical protein